MIQTTLGDIARAIGSIHALAGLDLRFKISYQISKTLQKVLKEMRNYDKLRFQALRKYGIILKDSEGKEILSNNMPMYGVRDDSEKRELYDIEIDELDNTEFKDDSLIPVRIADLEAALKPIKTANADVEKNKDEDSVIKPIILAPLLGWLVID